MGGCGNMEEADGVLGGSLLMVLNILYGASGAAIGQKKQCLFPLETTVL